MLENNVMPTCGSCAMLGTANTMACLAEALGMMLPGTATIPAVFSQRIQASSRSGEQIVQMVQKGLTARKIITLDALKNAIRLNSSIGGSTNTALHVPAIAYEAQINFSLELFDEFSSHTPLLVKLNPAAKENLADFHLAGGVQAVLKELESLLEVEAMTVTGKTVGENLQNIKQSNLSLIKKITNPHNQFGGLTVLKGNLAPDGAITKPAAIDPEMWYFQGNARVFNSEEEINTAIMNKKISPGEVLVVRYEGPKGGPGMPEMFRAMKLLNGMGLAKKTALITDGRFSGTNNGCFVGHISPEAHEGGPLAIVEDGDLITIDVVKKTVNLELSEGKIEKRLQTWIRPKKKITSGYLNIYSKLATSAAKGAIIPHRD